MKLPRTLAILPLLLLTTSFAEDLQSPRPTAARHIRILLHLAGSDRLIDYPDVDKILSSDPASISFETVDGFIVSHRGTYTIIEQKYGAGSRAQNPAGRRFFDPK
jgi:hypothetical protein